MKKNKAYKRLETDSSEEESKANHSKPLRITSKLKEELDKKNEEIQKLKQMLFETQEKLHSSVLNSSLQETSYKENCSEGLAETLPKPKKRFVEKFEDLVFVSKKNNLLLDEFEEIGFSKREDLFLGTQEAVVPQAQVLSQHPGKKSQKKEKNSFDLSLEASLPPGSSFSRSSEFFNDKDQDFHKSRKEVPEKPFVVSPKASEISKSPSQKSRNLHKNISKLENKGSGDSFADFSPANYLKTVSSTSQRCTPTLKNLENGESSDFKERSEEIEEKAGKSALKALEKEDSLAEFQSFLTNSFEDSQSKLKKILPGSRFSPSSPDFVGSDLKSTHKDRATLTDFNDLDPDVRRDLISESRIDQIDKELRESSGFIDKGFKSKSRNSSFPWIEPQKTEDVKPEKEQNEEKPQDTLKSKEKVKSNDKKVKKKRKISTENPRIAEKSPKISKKSNLKTLKLEKTLKNNPDGKSDPIKKRTLSTSNKKPPVPEKVAKKCLSIRANNVKVKKSSKKSPTQKGTNDSTLDDLIFDEEQDMVSWHDLMHRFRRNPEMIEKLMKVRIRPISREYRARSSSRVSKAASRVASSVNPSSSNTLSEYRPISASTITRKVKDPDWSSSVLDNYVAQNKKKFNFFSDFSLLGSQEIDEQLRSMEKNILNEKEMKKVFARMLKTLNVLKNELLLPEFWVVVPPFSEDSLLQGLNKCAKLIKARNLTVKIIDLIRRREIILEAVLGRKRFDCLKELERINEELMQVLVFWRYMELPFSNFLYLGEDYYVKIQTDNANISAVFPEFNVDDVYRPPKVSDSFNFDI